MGIVQADAGANRIVIPLAQERSLGKTRPSLSRSVDAEESSGRSHPGNLIHDKLARRGSQAEAPGEKPKTSSCASGESSGALAGEVRNIADSCVHIFQVEKLRLVPFHMVCRDVDSLSKSCLQVGISLAQLLLGHPRDGQYGSSSRFSMENT